MDYQGCQHPFTILYPLHFRESIRGYFAYNVSRAVAIGIDQTPIGCAIESTLDALAAECGLLITIVRVTHW
jgi:hypothetical protein